MSLLPFFHPSLLPSSSPVDHTDADREQCAAGQPAGWGGSWPWGRGPWWRRRRWRRPLARGCDARCNRWSRYEWVRARSGHPWALSALLSHPPHPSSPEGPPGLLNVRARRSSQPHGPRSPSPGLPSSPPAATQHTKCKLVLPQTFLFPAFFLMALIGSFWFY